MAGKSVPVVLVPRFTTYVGASIFGTEAIPVAAYAGIGLTFWHGPLLGSGALLAVSVGFQESVDGTVYADCPGGPWSITNSPGEFVLMAYFTKAWMRFFVTLAGTNPAVTCWAQGAFELRER